MGDTTQKTITYTGGNPKVEIRDLGIFVQGVPREIAVTEDQARHLAGKGFTVEDPSAKSRKEVTNG